MYLIFGVTNSIVLKQCPQHHLNMVPNTYAEEGISDKDTIKNK